MERLTTKRNNKVKDFLHKASRKIIEFANANDISHICIGNNRGWKQESGRKAVWGQQTARFYFGYGR